MTLRSLAKVLRSLANVFHYDATSLPYFQPQLHPSPPPPPPPPPSLLPTFRLRYNIYEKRSRDKRNLFQSLIYLYSEWKMAISSSYREATDCACASRLVSWPFSIILELHSDMWPLEECGGESEKQKINQREQKKRSMAEVNKDRFNMMGYIWLPGRSLLIAGKMIWKL